MASIQSQYISPLCTAFACGATVSLIQKYYRHITVRNQTNITNHRSISDVTRRIIAFLSNNAWLLAASVTFMIKASKSPILYKIGAMSSLWIGRLFYICKIKKKQTQETIPSEYHDDPILSQFTCLISHQPIVRPLKDPDTNALYQQDNLRKWIKQAGNFPVTRKPAHIFSTIGLEACTLSSLIAFRLEQLQKASSMDSATRKEWILKTAHELDRQIVALFNANLDLLQEIPDFLRSAPGMHVCPITAKPIRFPVKPDLDESAPLETHLICYEAATLTSFWTENPDRTPPKWPVGYAKTFKVSVDWSRQWDIKEALKENIDQLKKYYTPLKASN